MNNPIYYIKRIISILRNNSFSEIVYKTRCRIDRHRHPELNYLVRYHVVEFFISEKHNYFLCGIPKNASTSLVASIVHYDYNDELAANNRIWDYKPFWKDYAKFIYRNYRKPSDINLEQYKKYRKFVVLRNPYDRFISLINHTYTDRNFRGFLDNTLPSEQYVDQFLKYYPLINDWKRPDHRYERHAVPQRVFYEHYKALFGDDLEIVMIEDVKGFYKTISGNELIIQNESVHQGYICTKDSINDRQKRIIYKYIKKYEFCKNDEYTQYFTKYGY